MVSQELLGKFLGFIHEMPQIRTVIVFEEPHKGPISSSIEGTVCKIIAFEEVLKLGNLLEVFIASRNFHSNFILV